MNKIINISKAPVGWLDSPDYVYIGRSGHGLDGYFGNPIRLDERPRGSTFKEYEKYLINRLDTDEEFRNRVKELKGKTLVCFCKPKSCHGDILAKYVAILNTYGWD